MSNNNSVAPITVESLLDIVRSQRCLWGGVQLVTLPELERTVELLANGQSILSCMENDAMEEDNWKLNYLDARLSCLTKEVQDSVIYTTCPIDEPFQVGFYTDEGFIELINSSEFEQRDAA